MIAFGKKGLFIDDKDNIYELIHENGNEDFDKVMFLLADVISGEIYKTSAIDLGSKFKILTSDVMWLNKDLYKKYKVSLDNGMKLDGKLEASILKTQKTVIKKHQLSDKEIKGFSGERS